MAELRPGQLLVGAQRLPNGQLDTSRAMVMYPERPQFGEENPPIPQYWTRLIHGTNTARHRGNPSLLANPFYVIDKRSTGMSCITAEERLNRPGVSDTVKGYAAMRSRRGEIGSPVEINIIFPPSPATLAYRQLVPDYNARYGQGQTQDVATLTRNVHLQNEQHGRHPVLPRGMTLIKLADRTTNGIREVFYVPQQLYLIYEQELQRIPQKDQ